MNFSIGLRPERVQALDYEGPCETGKTWGTDPCHGTPRRQSRGLGWITGLAPALVGIDHYVAAAGETEVRLAEELLL